MVVQVVNAEPVLAQEPELASLRQRLMGALVDALIGMVLSIPFFMFTGAWGRIKDGGGLSLSETVIMIALGWVLFLMVHGVLLARHGQTVGKRVFGTRIVDMDGNVPSLAKVMLLRYMLLGIAGNIPGVGNLVPLGDILFIFRADRRCVHDMIAGTRVVTVASHPLTAPASATLELDRDKDVQHLKRPQMEDDGHDSETSQG